MIYLIQNILGKQILFSHFPAKIIDEEVDHDRYENEKIELAKLYHTNKCEYNIHGHLHSKKMSDKRYINVSLEQLIDMQPIKIKELLK